ncbi:hypothetical protein [Flammeovirga sp. SJP92]|uniref:hypothetical protein n=1 Tax=Flammeovirga sp. SJP92 TaxID=1775430 RepID=UPI000786C183|nr:hypothetical protein [Flammeovirga sp. SJP92]KXX69268.1 hypothetical protein AVL50_20115 [Flammeovirga sp. SJP92]
MKKNYIELTGYQYKSNLVPKKTLTKLIENPFINEWEKLSISSLKENSAHFYINEKGNYDLNKAIDFLFDEKYNSEDQSIGIFGEGIWMTIMSIKKDTDILKDRDKKDKAYRFNVSFSFKETALTKEQFPAFFEYLKPLFLEIDIPVKYFFKTRVTAETTDGKYKNIEYFKLFNKFPKTRFGINWRMILGELDYDKDFTIEKLDEIPALHKTKYLKQVKGKDYNLMEFHIYKDIYEYESDESMASFRETLNALKKSSIENKKNGLIPPEEKRFQIS